MPFLAEHQGEVVLPPLVDKGEDLICPKCSGKMMIKDGPEVARHFYHPPENSDCPGESPEHLRMKSIAYSNLAVEFPEATLDLWFDEEIELGASEYPDADVEMERGIGERRADIRVDFDQPRFPEGVGIGVEVQHRHESKDVEAVTEEYLQEEYSVLWLDSNDFDGYNVNLSGIITVWPYGVRHNFSEGVHESVLWLQNQEQPTVSRRVKFPAKLSQRRREEIRTSWEWGRFYAGEDDADTNFCFELLSRERSDWQKWIRIADAPDGDRRIQLGKQHDSGSLDQVTSRITKSSRQNRGKVHSLAYAVAESDPSPGGFTDIKKVWLDTGYGGPKLLLKLVSTPSGVHGLSLGRYGHGNDQFVTVSPNVESNIKSALHNIAEKLG